jgi:hypothetical protein
MAFPTAPSKLAILTAGLILAAGSNFLGGDEPDGSSRTPESSLRVSKAEKTLVSAVHKARNDYQASLERLRGYYIRSKNEEARYWVEQELTQYHMMVKDPYLLALDLPSRDLKPNQSIPEANKILADALEIMNRRTFTEGAKNYHRAEVLLRRLINDYEKSDKVDEACYYLGDIYSSKYFEQYRRAVAFYERVFLYEPNTNLDARLKAAIVYEKHLADRERAKELYQEVLARHTDPKQTSEARRRLDRLLGTRNPSRG